MRARARAVEPARARRGAHAGGGRASRGRCVGSTSTSAARPATLPPEGAHVGRLARGALHGSPPPRRRRFNPGDTARRFEGRAAAPLVEPSSRARVALSSAGIAGRAAIPPSFTSNEQVPPILHERGECKTQGGAQRVPFVGSPPGCGGAATPAVRVARGAWRCGTVRCRRS